MLALILRSLICLTLILFLTQQAEGNELLTGKVTEISDGDSFTFLSSDGDIRNIRLYGVDCPNIQQPYGKEATQFAERKLLGKEISVMPIVEKDKYGRTIALVMGPDGSLLNQALVQEGLAWVSGKYCKIQMCPEWAKEQSIAKRSRRGLWKDPNPIPPWQWRKNRR